MARRILLVLLSLVVLVVLAAGGLLTLLTFRPETFKGQAERYLSAQLGRPVTIDGRVAYRDAQNAVDIASSVATDPPKPGAVHDFGGLKLDGQGQVRGGPASFALEVGSPLLLAQGTATPFPVKGRLTLAGTDLKL